jgi:predicted oxidoreductase (fatty acid repression mutant protein)
MKMDLEKAIEQRRSYYTITNQSPISDKEIYDIVKKAILHVPSAFNSQSARAVVLLGDSHIKLWNIVKDTLRSLLLPENYPATESKINSSFASGYGTVLFFEDESVVLKFQESFPAYSDNFPIWSNQSAGMHQYAVWTMLESVGFGASLQHYNPLIDGDVKKEWNINPHWKLVAQMPFGLPTNPPGEKAYNPIDERILLFE